MANKFKYNNRLIILLLLFIISVIVEDLIKITGNNPIDSILFYIADITIIIILYNNVFFKYKFDEIGIKSGRFLGKRINYSEIKKVRISDNQIILYADMSEQNKYFIIDIDLLMTNVDKARNLLKNISESINNRQNAVEKNFLEFIDGKTDSLGKAQNKKGGIKYILLVVIIRLLFEEIFYTIEKITLVINKALSVAVFIDYTLIGLFVALGILSFILMEKKSYLVIGSYRLFYVIFFLFNEIYFYKEGISIVNSLSQLVGVVLLSAILFEYAKIIKSKRCFSPNNNL